MHGLQIAPKADAGVGDARVRLLLADAALDNGRMLDESASGTDAETIEVVRRAVGSALMTRDAQWVDRIRTIVEVSLQGVADALHQSYRQAGMLSSDTTARDGRRAAELAFDVIRQALPDVFATVEMSVREQTIQRGADGQIQRVISRTIDADAA